MTLRARFNPGRPSNSAVNLILPMLEGTGTRRSWSSAEGNPWYDVTPAGAAILGRVQADGELLERGGKGGPLFQIVEADEAARIDKSEAAAARRTRRPAPADGEWTADDFANLGITRTPQDAVTAEEPRPAVPPAAATGDGSAAKRVGRRPPVPATAKQTTTATQPMAEVKFATPTAELPFQGPPPAPKTPPAPPTLAEGETPPTAAA